MIRTQVPLAAVRRRTRVHAALQEAVQLVDGKREEARRVAQLGERHARCHEALPLRHLQQQGQG